MTTAKKTTKAKTAKTKTAKTKTAKTKPTKTKAATATKKTKGNPVAKLAQAKVDLLNELQDSGILETGMVEELELLGEGFDGLDVADGLTKSAQWDKRLTQSLQGFSKSGGDGRVSSKIQSLVTWQKNMNKWEPTVEGLTQAIESFKKVVPFTGATLYLRNQETSKVTPLVVSGFQVDLISRIRFTEGSGFSSWVATRQKPVLYSELRKNEAPREDQVHSFMAVPIVVGGECLGVVNLGHSESGSFTQSTLRNLMVASGALAGLLQRFVALRQIAAREIVNPNTGLATAHYLSSRLSEEVVRCRELGYSMSLMVFKLNELNDFGQRFGEDYLERSLKEVGEIVRNWKRATELVGHTEDDRFVAVFPGAGSEKATQRARDLLLALQQHSFPRRKRVTVSCGISGYPTDAENPQELLSVADNALSSDFRAKTGGPSTLSAAAAPLP